MVLFLIVIIIIAMALHHKLSNAVPRKTSEEETSEIARDAVFSVLSGMLSWHSSEDISSMDAIGIYEKEVEAAMSKVKSKKNIILEAEKIAVAALWDLDQTFTQEGEFEVAKPQSVYFEDIRLGGEYIENALQRVIDPEW